MASMSFVLLGESGHGKSSIVNALRDAATPEAAVGKNADGITKVVAAYAMPREWKLQLVDTPGFGCRHVPLVQLITAVEALLSGDTHGPVRGIAVTCPVDSPRLMLGTHVVQALVTLGVQGQNSWDHIVLVGTKCDRADDNDREFFETELVPAFFRSAPQGAHLHATVSQGDCSPLSEALRKLPEAPLLYRPPEAQRLAEGLAELLGEDVDGFANALTAARQGGRDPSAPLNLLVIGECGDGKSTLINALRDPSVSEEQEAGKHPKGVTKGVTCIAGLPIEGQKVNYFDTPGIGDMDVSVTDLCVMLEQVLKPEVSGGIDGLIVTCPTTNKYIRLGGQVVQTLVDLGFQGAHKWSKVILAGTKADRADTSEIDNFKAKIAQDFFRGAVACAEPGQAVLCAKGTNYEDLKQAIIHLPPDKITYRAPPAAELGKALGSVLGTGAEVVQAHTEEMRCLMEKVQAQKLQAKRDAAEFARKEKDLKMTRLLLAAEEARLAREAEDHLSSLSAYKEGAELQREVSIKQRKKHDESYHLQLQKVRRDKEAMIRKEMCLQQERKQKQAEERRRYEEYARQERQRLVQESNRRPAVIKSFDRVFASLGSLWPW